MRQVALLEKSLGIKKSQRKILKFPKSFGFLRDSTISIMNFDVDCLCDFGFAGWDRLCRA